MSRVGRLLPPVIIIFQLLHHSEISSNKTVQSFYFMKKLKSRKKARVGGQKNELKTSRVELIAERSQLFNYQFSIENYCPGNQFQLSIPERILKCYATNPNVLHPSPLLWNYDWTCGLPEVIIYCILWIPLISYSWRRDKSNFLRLEITNFTMGMNGSTRSLLPSPLVVIWSSLNQIPWTKQIRIMTIEIK